MDAEPKKTSVDSSHLDTTGQQLFELRFERTVSHAAALELASAYRGSGLADAGLWRKYHVPQPAGLWVLAAGRNMPALVSLYAWPGLNRREETLGRLLALRDGHDANPTSIRGAESWIMIESPSAKRLLGDAQPPAGLRLCELRIDRVLNGSGREAAESLCEHELAHVASLGGRLLGLYELAIGPARPVLVSLLEWNDQASPHAAWATLDGADAERQRFDERKKHGRRLFMECEQSFMSPVATAWPGEPAKG